MKIFSFINNVLIATIPIVIIPAIFNSIRNELILYFLVAGISWSNYIEGLYRR
jgi:hypothetical protein